MRGHFTRITASSHACVLSWSDTCLKHRYEWKNLQDTADIYLEHRVRALAEPLVFFSSRLPEPVVREWEGEED